MSAPKYICLKCGGPRVPLMRQTVIPKDEASFFKSKTLWGWGCLKCGDEEEEMK